MKFIHFYDNILAFLVALLRHLLETGDIIQALQS
jgi:hypothetical protein